MQRGRRGRGDVAAGAAGAGGVRGGRALRAREECAAGGRARSPTEGDGAAGMQRQRRRRALGQPDGAASMDRREDEARAEKTMGSRGSPARGIYRAGLYSRLGTPRQKGFFAGFSFPRGKTL